MVSRNTFRLFFAALVALPFLVACGDKKEEAAIETSSFVAQMARKTGGDASKLSPEERKRMDELTHGDTENTLRFHPAATMQPASPRN